MADKRVLGVFTLNCLQTGHWVRVDHYIVSDWAHVSVIVQCQRDSSNISCKDGAVVWLHFVQLTADCLTILEMAVDDSRSHSFWSRQCRFHHVIIAFRDTHWNKPGLLVWISYICLLLQWGRVSWDHNRAFLVEDCVSWGGRPIRHWSLPGYWLPLLWEQRQGSGSGHASSPIWHGNI